jgi:LPXTG-site transpeptidase (sortase) family protein
VTETKIVRPSDVGGLAGAPQRDLTLVTCYPFYYIGNAPKRFIVHARKLG